MNTLKSLNTIVLRYIRKSGNPDRRAYSRLENSSKYLNTRFGKWRSSLSSAISTPAWRRWTSALLAAHLQRRARRCQKKLPALLGRIKFWECDDKSKVFSAHAPEVACMSKDRVFQPSEFGVKKTAH